MRTRWGKWGRVLRLLMMWIMLGRQAEGRPFLYNAILVFLAYTQVDNKPWANIIAPFRYPEPDRKQGMNLWLLLESSKVLPARQNLDLCMGKISRNLWGNESNICNVPCLVLLAFIHALLASCIFCLIPQVNRLFKPTSSTSKYQNISSASFSASTTL